MSQLDLFRETPKPEAPRAPPRPYEPIDSLIVLLTDDPDQNRLAEYIVENHPDASAEILLGYISDAEETLRKWRCGDLADLRVALERTHPAWRPTP